MNFIKYFLFLSQSSQNEKSHGYLQLTGGNIEVLGNHMLGVDDKVSLLLHNV